jgi:uridine phosphorylase
MGTRYKNTDLLVNPDGSIYHLRLKPHQVAPYVILVGDPQRVKMLSKHFDHIECQVQNRELISHTGYLGNKRVTILSTGMGTDNIDIVIHELDALVNIDLNTYTRKASHTRLFIIRIGTSGAIQPDIPLNAFVVSEYGIGMDGLLNYYLDKDRMLEYEMAEAFRRHVRWPEVLPAPYAARGSDLLLRQLGEGFVRGITLTASGFYGPQGRSLRIGLANPGIFPKIESFSFNGFRITNFEMETAALYGLCRILGHEAVTICAAIANRSTNQYNPDYKATMEELIRIFLERLRNQLLINENP